MPVDFNVDGLYCSSLVDYCPHSSVVLEEEDYMAIASNYVATMTRKTRWLGKQAITQRRCPTLVPKDCKKTAHTVPVLTGTVVCHGGTPACCFVTHHSWHD